MRIGVDVGGTKIEAIALDAEGVELKRIRTATPKGDYEGTIGAIAGLVKQLESETGQTATVGVGIPGTVVRSTGLVKNANSIWLNGKPLQQDMSKTLDREVRCANDANCFTISEATDGAARGYEVVFGVIVGTGCGGGVAFGGQIHNGPNGLAGEWGHTPLPWPRADELPGPMCWCGKRNCLELWIAGPSLARDCDGPQAHDASRLPVRAAAGDIAARAALVRHADRMARGLAVIVNVLDPDVIVLGGGLSNMEHLYVELPKLLKKYVFSDFVDTPIVRNRHGDSSGVRGAAWLWPLPG